MERMVCIKKDTWVNRKTKLPTSYGPKFGEVVTIVNTYTNQGRVYYTLSGYGDIEVYRSCFFVNETEFSNQAELALSDFDLLLTL